MFYHGRGVAFSVVLLLQIMTPASALADSANDCDSNEPDRKLRGCSAIISEGKLTGEALAIAYSRRSDVYLSYGEFDKAIADGAKAAELEPDHFDHKKRLSDAYRLRGNVYAEKDETERAIADFSEALRIEPGNHYAHFARASAYLRGNMFDKAIADLTKAIEIDPSVSEYKRQLSRLYDQRGIERLLKRDFDEAIADYTEAIRLDPAAPALYLNRSAAHVGKKHVDRAIQDLSEAIRLDPELAEAYFRRAQLYHGQKARGLAIADLDEVIKRMPQNVPALMLRGLEREELGQHDKAIADYQAALAVEPSHKMAKASLERVRRAKRTSATKDVVVATPPKTPPMNQTGSFAIHINYDLEGGDLKQLKYQDQSDCAAACQSEGDCRAYTFDKWNRWCFLKSSLGTLRLEPKCVSGTREGAGTPTPASSAVIVERYRNKAFPEGGEASTFAEYQQCETSCRDDASCVAFTYFKASGQCRLLTEADEYFSNSDADSGVKRQLPSQ
jgi:tetratricopeptide (TPR) repeat protein